MSPAQAKPKASAQAKAAKLGAQGTVDLPKQVFSEPFHRDVVYQAARAEQLAVRRGTAATKTRAEVRGGGAKPWRQKGTGRARAGSSRAPHWTGGGIAFGPSPRGYTIKVNRKARRRALRAALSLHAERESIAVVDAPAFEEPSTQQAADLLDDWEAQLPVLVLLADDEEACAKSFRNIDRVEVCPAAGAGVAGVLGAASVVVSAAALDVLTNSAVEPSRENG
jgi:large subunit ribosomal protein L4